MATPARKVDDPTRLILQLFAAIKAGDRQLAFALGARIRKHYAAIAADSASDVPFAFPDLRGDR